MKKIALYDPAYEHDSCGVGCLCRLDGASTHELVADSLKLLVNLTHRGAAGADADSGDGAGLIIRVPDKFFRREFPAGLPPYGSYGLGMFFLPRDPSSAARARELTENQAGLLGWRIHAWREVPTDHAKVGRYAALNRPSVWQAAFYQPGKEGIDQDDLERALYVLRKSVEKKALSAGFSLDDFYVPSLSSRTIVYKGMMYAAQLEGFYPELTDPLIESPLTVIHQRYSTNTFPSWRLAQPFRLLGHNGEINTIRGNRAWLSARESKLRSPLFGDDIKKLFPLIEAHASDSASLDNTLEFLTRGGRSLEHSLSMLLPQAWGKKYPMSSNLRGFFEYHAGLMEPWDGPAAVCVTDGLKVAAALDRNGLRPARYTLSADGLFVFSSEAGALEMEPERIIEKGSLRPGEMILAEAGAGVLMKNTEIKSILARRRPYRRWVSENRIDIPGFYAAASDFETSLSDLKFRQSLSGYTRDDTEVLLKPMASTGQEPVGSMGADVPLAVLDDKPGSLFSFFRQQFAQITNPPIDPIREELVMSVMTFIGYDPNILAEEPGQARLVKLAHPFLSNSDLRRLEKDLSYADFHAAKLDSTFIPPGPGAEPGSAMEAALDRLEDEAQKAAENGARIIILSDRLAGTPAAASESAGSAGGGDALNPPVKLPLPSPLAVAAVNRRLLETGFRVSVGIVCEIADALEVSHMAMLLSLGASAVNPYLAYETVADMAKRDALAAPMSATRAVENYVNALRKGLLKIMSKMGISTLRGYRGARIFEAVGLGPEIMRKYFQGVPSGVGGLGLRHFEKTAVDLWKGSDFYRTIPKKSPLGDPARGLLPVGGSYRLRQGGARHLWTAESVTTLQEAVRKGDYGLYEKYAEMINDQSRKAFTLRGQLEFKKGDPVDLSEVEEVASIVKRFATGAMSFGSLSKEAHETMALAMNSLGARSNSGEGGEDPARYLPRPDGRSAVSKVKQVASGRFGVTAEYLAHAEELQIKIAQGAKPGEGGQLPGHKVDTEIARVRHSTPGVTLISPPPHHDIYSIEDIAQLIYDLHQAADQATVCVKLVSEAGVGTIAAGVAKAMAESILISGFDGGTGASPLSSIRHAGSPWELGLAETQQTLVLNNLRSRVRLQCDGQMKTGRDVAVAALLGADEFGFATAVLISMGCLMMRKCHTNGCPVGVATQDPLLRARFKGKVEHVENYFKFVARELREHMAYLGFRTVDEMIGRSDRLRPRADSPLIAERGLDFAAILHKPETNELGFKKYAVVRDQNTLDDRLLPRIAPALERGQKVVVESRVLNTDRTVGAKISSRVVRRLGPLGLPPDTITVKLKGIAGQSFGAFAARGLTLDLEGEANDYVGKGLSGGKLIIRPPRNSHPDFVPSKNAVAGNVTLYGATSGELYMSGLAGERFAVRNSGALAVVEGVGDHGCEYMTGGRAVILGSTGVNFAAGMSGGLAYVYDPDGFFDVHCNLEMVDLDLLDEQDQEELFALISRHRHFTGSAVAAAILLGWNKERDRFVKVFPLEYRRGITLERRRIPLPEEESSAIPFAGEEAKALGI
ncbi:MAG: glutamate synthase large subunit [Deltaproteobacteria bacterium]|jgi:glutamate synthase domain-containing protein 2/glutamate synthase domain-containing protein 1/glutamate synthase domain-containing protein 3|nr:glutamate synthase large subunit [Deltaproteobacteria bacterium]